MASAWVLLGDLDDWIRLGVIVFFILGPLINHFGKKPARNARGGNVRGPQQPAPPQPQGQPKGLVGEIERILREAQQAAEEAAKKAEGKREVAEARRQPAEGRRELPRARAAEKEPTIVIVEEVQERSSKQRRGPVKSLVAKHVEEHIQSRPVSDHGKLLGRRISQTDERIEKRVQEKFDHQLGGLTSTTVAEPAEDRSTSSPVWDGFADARAREAEILNSRREFIYAMLHDREQLRNAFVFAEIFGRPRAETMDS